MIALCKLTLVVHIDFADVIAFLCQLFHCRSLHPAGSAPGCPEVYQNGACRLQYLFFKIIHGNIFSHIFLSFLHTFFCTCRVCVKCAQTQISRLKNSIFRNCSVPSQLRAKIHSKSAVPIGFLPSSLSFLTVSTVNAQTYGTVTIFQSLFYSVYDTRVNSSKNLLQAHLPRISDLLTLISVYPQIVLFSITKS